MLPEKVLKDQIQGLQSAGHEVIAVCAPRGRVEEIRKQGIPVITVPMEREISPFKDLRSLLQLVRCFRSQQFDFVYSGSGPVGQLFRDVSSLQPRYNVKTVRANCPCNLLNGYIRVTTQIGNIAAIVFVAEDDSYGKAPLGKRVRHAALPGLEFFSGNCEMLIYCGGGFKDPAHQLAFLVELAKSRFSDT